MPQEDDNPTFEFGRLAYADLSAERLRLSLEVSIVSPRDNVVLQGVSFEDISVNGLPIFVEPFEGQVKLEKGKPVPLPAPLALELDFRAITSFDSVRQLLSTKQLWLKGTAHVRVRLSGVPGLFTLGQSLRRTLPVQATVRLELLENPLLRAASDRVLAELSDPRGALNVRWVEEKLQLQALLRAGGNLSHGLALIETRYRIVGPGNAWKLDLPQFGVGFLVAPRRLVTAKPVVEPWKFDAQLMALLAGGARLDPKGYEVLVRPVVAEPDGTEARERFTLRLSAKELSVRTQEDDWAEVSGEAGGEGKVRVHHLQSRRSGAVLVLRRKLSAKELVPAETTVDNKETLLGLGYVSPAESAENNLPRTGWAVAKWGDGVATLDRHFPPYAAGGPLFDIRGRVRAVFLGEDSCLLIEALTPLLQK